MTSKKPGARISKTVRKMLDNSQDYNLILTPRLEEFLVRWDGVVPKWVAKIIADLMSRPERDRSGSFSASSAGLCLRRQELTFVGAPQRGFTDPKTQLIYNNGKWVHLRWQAMLLTAGLIDAAEVTVKRPSQRARATLDGMGWSKTGRFKGRPFGFELKGRNDWAFGNQKAQGVDEKTRKQVDFEIMMSGLDVMVILNENKNDQERVEWVFFRDSERIKDAREELDELNRAVDRGKFHPMLPDCKEGVGEFKRCPYGGPAGACIAAGRRMP